MSAHVYRQAARPGEGLAAGGAGVGSQLILQEGTDRKNQARLQDGRGCGV